MEEQLISFETAKLAKEKGFNQWLPMHGFDAEGTPNWNRKFIAQRWSETNQVRISIEEKSKDAYARPTQSLLQKWLRDVHEKHIVVELTDNTRAYYWEMYISDGVNREYNDEDFIDQAKNIFYWNKNFNTYEEALEFGLLEALQLV